MMWSHIFNNAIKAVKQNSPDILTGVGVAGVLSTIVLTAKGSFDAATIIQVDELSTGTNPDPKERLKERTKAVWRCYVPAAASATVTIGCIIGANRQSSTRTAIAATAYSVTERAFTEYREKVVEEIGEGKEQAIRDQIAQDQRNRDAGLREVIVTGSGDVLCCERLTGRYFKSDMETLRKAQNDINALIINEIYVTLSEFYDRVGLPETSQANRLGWDSTKLMELEFSTTLNKAGEPCLAFEYNYVKPLQRYSRKRNNVYNEDQPKGQNQ